MNSRLRQLNDYYDKIYVLSVQAAEDRRNLFAKRFAGLDYSFFYGADKNNFTANELIEKNIYSVELTQKHHRYSKEMLLGEIACAWSHRMIYEDMIRNNYKRIFIFEDDAVPNFEVLKNISLIIEEIPQDCELLMWGWSKNGKRTFLTALKQGLYHLQSGIGLLKWDATTIKNLFARSYSANIKKAGFHDFTYAYAVTRIGAEKLLQMQTPLQYVADNLLAYACTKEMVKGYIVYPTAFLHDSLADGTARDSYIR